MTTAAVGVPSAQRFAERDAEIRRDLAEFALEAHMCLGVELELGADSQLDIERSLEAVAAVALLVLAELEARLRHSELYRRMAALIGVESAIARLRSIPGADQLAEAACAELLRGSGFNRVMLSRVRGTTWTPWLAKFTHREVRDSDAEWMASGQIPLNRMVLESQLLEERRPGFSADTANDPRVAPEFTEQTQSRSYAVAPIMPKGRVIGLLHADYYPADRRVDDVDAHLLGEFADGFGRLYERAALLDRLARERDQVRETLRSTEIIMDNLARAEVELIRKTDGRGSATAAVSLSLDAGVSGIEANLTAREREVLMLLVTGQTNSAIAEHLVISEGTVKSHVKQILRKLGAVNRSEVIAQYLGLIPRA